VKARLPGIACLILGAAGATAQSPPTLETRVDVLERKMRTLDPTFVPLAEATIEQRLIALEARMAEALRSKSNVSAAPVPPPGPEAAGGALQPVSISGDFQKAADPETRLPVAGYMDFHVNRDSGDSFRPDFHRFVLLFGHSFSNRVKFWSELELERSLVEGGEASGEVALEQAYLDFLITPRLNFRAGMLLTPVGIVNERHEPPSFNGVERPFVETTIIPTTWRELGFGLTGDLGRGFRYRTYLTSALDASRFNAEAGISEGKSSGLDASMRNPATVGRLEFAGVRRLTLGASMYSGLAGYNSPGLNPRVSIANFDGRYRVGRLEMRGLFAHTWLSKAGELNQRIRQQTGVNPNTASQMRGYYFEPALHVAPRRWRHDVIAFTRFERFNTQERMPAGYVALPQFNRSAWVTGVTYKPVPDVALKFDYVFNRNQSSVVKPLNGVNLGIGWWF